MGDLNLNLSEGERNGIMQIFDMPVIRSGGSGIKRCKCRVRRRIVQFYDMLVNKRKYRKVCSKRKEITIYHIEQNFRKYQHPSLLLLLRSLLPYHSQPYFLGPDQ